MSVPIGRDEEKKKCPGCRGRGVQKNNDGLKIRCPVCNGSGKVRKEFGDDDNSLFMRDTYSDSSEIQFR